MLTGLNLILLLQRIQLFSRKTLNPTSRQNSMFKSHQMIKTSQSPKITQILFVSCCKCMQRSQVLNLPLQLFLLATTHTNPYRHTQNSFLKILHPLLLALALAYMLKITKVNSFFCKSPLTPCTFLKGGKDWRMKLMDKKKSPSFSSMEITVGSW